MLTPNTACSEAVSVAEINSSCFCLPFHAADRRVRVANGSRDPRIASLLEDRPGLYAATAVFLTRDHYRQMAGLVKAVAEATATASYEAAIRSRDADVDLACQRASHSVLMGFDFHVSASGPRLIEINTNAGAAFLTKQFAEAGWGCRPAATTGGDFEEARLDTLLMAMFAEEWDSLRPGQPLRSIAIVDDAPETQYLYPDMLLAAELLQSHGINAVVTDPSALDHHAGKLMHKGEVIDLVYNRLTDFQLVDEAHRILQKAYVEDIAVISPSPRHHALYADKRNLILLGGEGQPGAVGAGLRAMIPRTRALNALDPVAAWKQRRKLFFKPAGGFGSRAAYRGDKLTTQVWQDIQKGDYVAQDYVPPASRSLMVEGAPVNLKYDIRLFAYAGKPLFPVARIYSGQTTNFRTQGGGLAPVILV